MPLAAGWLEFCCAEDIWNGVPGRHTMLKFILNAFFAVMGAGPCLLFAVLFFRVWQTPMAIDDGGWVKLGVGIMVLEFILVHSGGVFGALAERKDDDGMPRGLRGRVLMMLALVCFYTVFAVTFSVVFDNWSLFWIFCWVTVSRLLTMILDARYGSRIMTARTKISALLYLCCMFLSCVVRIPRGGLTREVLDAVYPTRGDGIWETDPQQALLAGMVYFGLLGLWELTAPFLARRKKRLSAT